MARGGIFHDARVIVLVQRFHGAVIHGEWLYTCPQSLAFEDLHNHNNQPLTRYGNYAYTTQLNTIYIAQNYVKHAKTRYPPHTTTLKPPTQTPLPTNPNRPRLLPRNQPIVSPPSAPHTTTHEHPRAPSDPSDLRSQIPQIPDPEPKGPQVPQPPHDLRPRPHPRPHHPLPHSPRAAPPPCGTVPVRFRAPASAAAGHDVVLSADCPGSPLSGVCAAGRRRDGGRRLRSGEERAAGGGGEGGAVQGSSMGWRCKDPGVSSYFGPIARANWALGRVRGEVVQEVQEEVVAAPAAREVDGVKEPAMAGRPGQCLEEPVPGVDAVVGATVARERGGMKGLRIWLDGRGTGGDAVKKGSRTTRGAAAVLYTSSLGLLVTAQ